MASKPRTLAPTMGPVIFHRPRIFRYWIPATIDLSRRRSLSRMPISDRINRCLEILLEPGSLRAMATWPKFSITSFKMVSALARQGILPRSLIDVGANVGQFAIAASMIYSGLEVHSFEPVPETIARLRQNVRAFRTSKSIRSRSARCRAAALCTSIHTVNRVLCCRSKTRI